MLTLLRGALGWIARHAVILAVVILALVALAAAQRAWSELPVLEAEQATLAESKELLGTRTDAERQRGAAALAMLDRRGDAALRARLSQVAAQRAALPAVRPGATEIALLAANGDAAGIAERYAVGVRRELLAREEASIRRILAHRLRTGRPNTRLGTVPAAQLELRRVRAQRLAIERRYPNLIRLRIPGLADQTVFGPWNRHRALQRREAALERRLAVLGKLDATRVAVARLAVDTRLIDTAIRERGEAIATSPVNRVWLAVRPVLSTALWILAGVVLLPIALKVFWFFVVARLAARSAPVVIRPDLRGDVDWATHRIAPGAGPEPGSSVARRVVLRAGDELLVKPEWLQSSMTDAAIDSKLLLDWSIPLGSIATGLVGLTRIRAGHDAFATIAASRDAFDEVGVIAIPAGAALVFHPHALIGVIQRVAAPIRIERFWRIGHLSAWLTLQLRYLVFHGPGELIVRGARGVALEPAEAERRIAGASTLGWSAGARYRVRRSETFLAYLRGQQSLFNDSFAGDGARVVYEQMPRGSRRGGILGRGLEGLGDGLLKVFGL